MDKFKFSQAVIPAEKWYELTRNNPGNKLVPGVLVVATDSTLEFLAGPLNLVERIVVISYDFNDGRFFSIGRLIRLHGYCRRLAVGGDILPDQYTALLSCGFDEVLILDDSSTSRVVALDNAIALAGGLDPESSNPEAFTLAGPSQ
jgi:uncharacterized protein (DUF934 family)